MKALAILWTALAMGCTSAQGEEALGKLARGISTADSDLRSSYARELTIAGCLDLRDENVKPCVREVLACATGTSGDACAASVVARWETTKEVMLALRALWCGFAPASEGC